MPGLGLLLIVLLLFNPLKDTVEELVRPHLVEEVRPVLGYVQTHREEGDIIYCYYDAEPALKYYILQGKIAPIPTIVGIAARDQWNKYWQDIGQLRGHARVWVLFSHVYHDGGADEEKLFVDYLDRMGRRLDSVRATGAAAYLYDCSGQSSGGPAG
jgi:hypothetical protein